MKKFKLFLFLMAFFGIIRANNTNDQRSSNLDATGDTLIYQNKQLEEVVVVSNPKSQANTFETPGAISVFNATQIERDNLISVKNISAMAPNFFIPDYGSKLTTAIYIRGIGTRTNNSVVGLYVDNIPYMDKSIFDFDFLDIERLEVLRGPQSTLYGRNTMAGLINIYTKSPFDHQYTKASISYGNYNSFRASLSRYGKITDKLAYSLSAQYQSRDGYFTNEATGNKADSTRAANGRFQLYWRPNQSTNVHLTTNFEYSWQGGYPYEMIDKKTNELQPVNYNDPGAYDRTLSSSSLYIENKFDNVTMTNATGYQFFDDDMKLDQDFSEKSIFTLNQKQRQHSVSHELVLKSNQERNFKWLAGAFGFYQSLHTNAPVTFKQDGIQSMINDTIKKYVKPYGPMIAMTDTLTNENMIIEGIFDTPTWGVAGYTQWTYDNFLIDHLSISAGVRVDYEKAKMNYNSFATAYAHSRFQMPPTMGNINLDKTDNIYISEKGKSEIDHLEVLPRFDIRYIPTNRWMMYGTISKGFRAGGFNFQMFSDVIRARLQSNMVGTFIDNIKNTVTEQAPTMSGMVDKMIPKYVTDMAVEPEFDIDNYITYKPEYSWNYEIGTRLEPVSNILYLDLSAFYIDVRNQQVSAFSEKGLGRITKNSGKSKSYGLEAGIKYYPLPQLSLSANYGFTHATFVENYTEKKIKNDEGEDEIVRIDYKDNYVPFAPLHTFSASANYLLTLRNSWLDYLNFNAQYAGLGKMYWTESNDQKQDFYGTLNAKISAHKGIFELGIWGKNLTNTQYRSFYFESLGNKLAQKGAPLTFGGEFIVRF